MCRTAVPNGDTLSTVFLELRSKLARAVSGIVPPKEIEDIVQETYLRVLQVSEPGHVRRPKAFLYRTARNLALDYAKRSETRVTDLEADGSAIEGIGGADGDDQTLRAVTSDEEFARFCDAVRYLPIQCRRAFVLRKVYGYSQKEIAEIMAISQSTVEKHIAEGVKRTFLRARQGLRAGGDAVAVTRLAAARRNDE